MSTPRKFALGAVIAAAVAILGVLGSLAVTTWEASAQLATARSDLAGLKVREAEDRAALAGHEAQDSHKGTAVRLARIETMLEGLVKSVEEMRGDLKMHVFAGKLVP